MERDKPETHRHPELTRLWMLTMEKTQILETGNCLVETIQEAV